MCPLQKVEVSVLSMVIFPMRRVLQVKRDHDQHDCSFFVFCFFEEKKNFIKNLSFWDQRETEYKEKRQYEEGKKSAEMSV